MGLYNRLKQRKQNGEPLDMKQVTADMLYQLWWKEDCSDTAIANLFDVQSKKITNLRHKWGIKVPETIVREFETKFGEEIPPLTEEVQKHPLMPEGVLLLRKVDELNDLELESLRLELARRYEPFAQVMHEVEFLALLENVVRTYWAK